MTNGEGGRHPEESRVDYVIDRINTVGTVWMGLTLGCAQCHDHKYDPISQKEYYSLSAGSNQDRSRRGYITSVAQALSKRNPSQRIEPQQKMLGGALPLQKLPRVVVVFAPH